MLWISVVQQDFFIRTFNRNPRLEIYSCPQKILISLQFQQFHVNRNYYYPVLILSFAYFQAKHYLPSKAVRVEKKNASKF